jgi:hypothetical protein
MFIASQMTVLVYGVFTTESMMTVVIYSTASTESFVKPLKSGSTNISDQFSMENHFVLKEWDSSTFHILGALCKKHLHHHVRFDLALAFQVQCSPAVLPVPVWTVPHFT